MHLPVLDLLLPCPCVACGTEHGPVCRSCRPQRWQPRRRDPTPRPVGLPPVWTADELAGSMRGLVLAYKEDGCWPAMRPLGTALADTVVAATGRRDGPLLLVPVPSSAAARRRRGHHHVLALCRRAARGDRLARSVTVRALLVPTRQVADQRGLHAHERQQNLAGSLRCRPVPSRLAG